LWADIPLLPAALAFYGAGVGLESIARGTLPLAMFGAAGYATLMGRLGIPSLIAQASAPWIGALLLEHTSARSTLAFVAGVALLNIALTIASAGWSSSAALECRSPDCAFDAVHRASARPRSTRRGGTC